MAARPPRAMAVVNGRPLGQTFTQFSRCRRQQYVTQLLSVDDRATYCSCAHAAPLGALTFPILQRLAEAVVLVSEDEIRQAVKFLLLRLRVLVQPSGAAAAAAVLFGKLRPESRP